jgi:Flp pilus assembly protein TadG
MAALAARREHVRSATGAALVEFALVLPLLLVMIGGIVDFAFLFQRYEVVTGAAREGARLAVLPGYACVSTQVEARVREFLMAGLHMSAADLLGVVPAGNITVTCGTLPAPLTTIPAARVEVTYQHTFLLLGPVMGLIGSGGWGGQFNMVGTSEMRMEMAP